MLLIEQLLANALEHPDDAALIEVLDRASIREVSWSQVGMQVFRLARRMAAAGIESGQHVAILCGNRRELVLALAALRLVGYHGPRRVAARSAVDIVIDTRLPDAAIAALIEHADAQSVIVDAPHEKRPIPLPARCRSIPMESLFESNRAQSVDFDALQHAAAWTAGLDPSHPEAILYTSGTTADPKGVVLTHGNLSSNAAGKLAAVPQQPSDRRLTLLPISHAYARTCDVGTWILSRSVLTVAGGYDGLLRCAVEIRPTLMNVVPYLAEKIACAVESSQQPHQELALQGLDRLRLLGCGGAALTRSAFECFANLGITVIQGYGLTETSPVICSATPEDAAPGVVGRPIAGVELKIDPQGQILCRGPGLSSTYYKQSEAMSLRMRDGWLQTGDLGSLDSQGRLRIEGRLDDMIVLSTGRKVMPTQVEARICRLPGIEHVVVSGNGRPMLTAWIAGSNGTGCSEIDFQSLQMRIDEALGDLPRHAIPRVVRSIPFALSVEDGTLTAKGTVRRGEILRRVQHSVE